MAYGQLRRKIARPSWKARRVSSSSPAVTHAGLTPLAIVPRRKASAASARSGSGKIAPARSITSVPLAHIASSTFTTMPLVLLALPEVAVEPDRRSPALIRATWSTSSA